MNCTSPLWLDVFRDHQVHQGSWGLRVGGASQDSPAYLVSKVNQALQVPRYETAFPKC